MRLVVCRVYITLVCIAYATLAVLHPKEPSERLYIASDVGPMAGRPSLPEKLILRLVSIMLSDYDSSRAGAPDTGYALGAGGQWATEAENGVMKGGTLKSDASQRFDDFPSEQPSLGEVERWMQNARSKMT